MARKIKMIFIDVGGFGDDASLWAPDPNFGFDVVYCFEPVKTCYGSIEARVTEPKLEVIHSALSDFDGHNWIFADAI